MKGKKKTTEAEEEILESRIEDLRTRIREGVDEVYKAGEAKGKQLAYEHVLEMLNPRVNLKGHLPPDGLMGALECATRDNPNTILYYLTQSALKYIKVVQEKVPEYIRKDLLDAMGDEKAAEKKLEEIKSIFNSIGAFCYADLEKLLIETKIIPKED